MTVPVHLSQRARWAGEQPVAFLMQQAVDRAEVISLAAGLVDHTSLPSVAACEAACILLQHSNARSSLQYGTTLGYPDLRRQVQERYIDQEHLDGQNPNVDLDQIIITSGSQQFLHLVSEALIDPGDIVLMSSPSYFVYMGTLANLGARVIGVPMDEHGMSLDALQNIMCQLQQEGSVDRVKLIYVISYYQNPTGVSLSEERRPLLLELARNWSEKQRIFVLEDAAYRELRYEGPEFHSLHYYDAPGDTVIHCQTFSKPFAPGLRTGFGFLPRSLVAAVTDLKGNQDFGSPNFNQQLLSVVMDQGLYESHLQKLKRVYKKKLGVMLQALDQYCSGFQGVEWIRPHGGLYVWMKLPMSIDTGSGSLFFQIALKKGMTYVPGEFCFPSESTQVHQSCLRLSFGVESEANICEGIRRLAQAIDETISRNPPR
ncbi:MAG: PLP-dependent aminotransferase family protein [Planctomycetota bacterium]|nr:PLP-dependent aminotransferase family protein [Planctomycetota bacterium]